MKIQRIKIMILIIVLSLVIQSNNQTIPTILPENNLLNSQTNYIMNYFSVRSFFTNSYFQIDFSQSDIIVPDSSINISATINSNQINSTSLNASCSNKICILKLGTAFSSGTNIIINFGSFRNPRYTATQRIGVFMFYSTNMNQTQSISISSSVYVPMPVIVNSVYQSDYGVGSLQVQYKFNLSFSYIPKDPQISIQIPSQVGYNSIDTQILFYGTIQNILPFLTSNMIILQFRTDQIVNPNGFMLLTLKGFRNPRYIGYSSSFNVTMVQKKTPTTNNCVTCRVAYLYSNSTNLLKVSSNTPGDISINLFSSSNSMVSQKTNLTIGIKIVAPIPQGGKFRVILPSSVQPTLPIYCQAIYGFTITNPYSCNFNTLLNAIQTTNLSVPYLQQTGDAILKISVINPMDNRENMLNFQTLDDQNRKIGKSKQGYSFKANPLSLSATVSKNNTQIQSIFTLSANVTLKKPLNISTDYILVILPASDYYNISDITCYSSTLSSTLNCTKSIQSISKNLLIKFSPPCSLSLCLVNSSFSFKISNIINPSYISDQTSLIQIQTISQYNSVIQLFNQNILLKQKQLIVNNYQWIGGDMIGNDFNIKISYEIPKFIQKYGGYLVMNFNKNVVFMNLLNNGQFPSSLLVVNENNQSLLNTLQYYNDDTPYSLKSISIKICTNDSQCSTNITISTLRKPFNPLVTSFQNLSCTTLYNQGTSIGIVDLSLFLPKILQSSLDLNITNSITNSISNYIYKFNMNKIPFDSGLIIKLSNKHNIQIVNNNSRCFVQVNPSNVLGYGMDCSILNSTSIQLSYVGDQTSMLSSLLTYTITLINVVNPPSLLPYVYRIQTSFNSIINILFNISLSINKAQSLLLREGIISSNRTFGQNTQLNIRLKNGFYQPYDQLKIYIPKSHYNKFYSYNNISVSLSNSSSLQNYGYAQNSSYFIIDKIYSLFNYSLILSLCNIQSTSSNNNNIIIQMYIQGYLSSKGIFLLPRIQPIFLDVNINTSNRYVGQYTTLNIKIRRIMLYKQQKYIKIYFNKTVLEYDNNLLTNQISSQYGDVYTYKQSINQTKWLVNNTQIIILNNLINIKYIPNSNTILNKLPLLRIVTLDQNNSIISENNISADYLTPLMVKQPLIFSSVRNNKQSNDITNISINIVSKYAQKLKRIKIQLPKLQNKFLNTSICYISNSNTLSINSSQLCSILFKTQQTYILQYIPYNKSTQQNIQITLLSILNQYQTSNKLNVTLMTENNQSIQFVSKQTTPSIQVDSLIITSAIANSSIISDNVKLQFVIKNVQNDMKIGSKIMFKLPEKLYTKILSINSKECQYQIFNVKYTGCQYTNTNKFKYPWLEDITLTINNTLANNIQMIPSNTPIKITLYLTNPFTSYSFSNKSILITTLTPDYVQDSYGLVTLSGLYPNQYQFKQQNIVKYSYIQSNLNCNEQNIITISIKTPTLLSKQTYLLIKLPSLVYDISSLFSTPDINTLSITQNTSQGIISIKQLIKCSTQYQQQYSNQLCLNIDQNITYSFKIKNDKYISLLLKDQNKKVNIQLLNDQIKVTNNLLININDRIPININKLELRKNNQMTNQVTDVTVIFQLLSLSQFNTNSSSTSNNNKLFNVTITPVNSTINILSIISSYNLLLNNISSNLISSFIDKDKNSIILTLQTNISTTTNNIIITLNGYNPKYAPNSINQTYKISISTNEYIYYSNNINMNGSNRLIPLNKGLNIKRSNNIVQNKANYTLFGNLLYNGLNNAKIIFNNNLISSLNNSLTKFDNVILGEYLNPISVNQKVYQNLRICNNTHILFSNMNILTQPQLIGKQLVIDYIKSIKYNNNMLINTQQKLQLTFINPIYYMLQNIVNNNISKFNIKIPKIYNKIKQIKINDVIIGINEYILHQVQSQQQSILQFSLLPSSSIRSILTSTTTTTKFSILFSTSLYQITNIIFPYISIQLQYPTYQSKIDFNVNVYGNYIKTIFNISSFKVNQQSAIKLIIQPIQKNSILRVYLPKYINIQINSIFNNTLQHLKDYMKIQLTNGMDNIGKEMQVNQVSTLRKMYQSQSIDNSFLFYIQLPINLTNTITKIQLTLNNITNPFTNQLYQFIIQQHQLPTNTTSNLQNIKIFGHSSQNIQMRQLQRIKIYQTQRNSSKIGQNVSIKIKLQLFKNSNKQFLTNINTQNCIIILSQTQVKRKDSLSLSNTTQCQIYINDNPTANNCKLHPILKNAIITRCYLGINTYTIKKAYKNLDYSLIPKQLDKPYIYIGQPYKMGQSLINQTQYMLPLITAGNMILNNINISNNIKLQKSTLNLLLNLQNIKQVNFMLLAFQSRHYIIDKNIIKCKINKVLRECFIVEEQANKVILINSTGLMNSQVNIDIQGLINYIQQQNFTIKSMKYIGNNNAMTNLSSLSSTTKSISLNQYAMIDYYLSNPLQYKFTFIPNKYRIRIINSQSYVSKTIQKVRIIFDDQYKLPTILKDNNKKLLRFNITTNYFNNCKYNETNNLKSIQYNTQIILQCLFNESKTLQIQVKLYSILNQQKQLSNTIITSFISPPLTDKCKNYMCNKCSINQYNQEKCYQCRDNYLEYQNTCVQKCPNGFVEFKQGNTCQKCSINCLTCYSIYPDNCLKCKQSNYISNNGICKLQCKPNQHQQNGYCVGDNQCYDQGCRYCSIDGFCYQCLPDYYNQPNCKWQPLLPSLFMTYFTLPFLICAIISSIYVMIKKGIIQLTYQCLFSFSLLQFFIWVFITPALHTKQQALFILSMIILRIVISIVSYQTYYKKQINSNIKLSEEQTLLKQDKSHKSQQKSENHNKNKQQQYQIIQQTFILKILKFLAHLVGPDIYEEFKVLYNNKIRIQHNNLYLIFSLINRLLVLIFSFYILSQTLTDDLLYLPILNILSAIVIYGIRLVRSQKISKLINLLRNR